MATRMKKGDILAASAGAILALVFLLPMVYTVVSSVKPLPEILRVPFQWIPRTVQLSNFTEPLIYGRFGRYFLNSIIVAIAVTAAELFFSSLAGFSLAKYRYRGRTIFFTAILAVMIVPIETIIVPLGIIVRAFGLMNSYSGLIIPVAITPFGVFWMRQFFLTLPNDYIEAARVDGMREFQIFRSIAWPMAGPAVFALLIFAFMGNWNSFIWPLVVARADAFRTIPVGLVSFQEEFGTSWHYLFAMSVLAIIPTAFIFIAFRKRLLHGLAMIGIKG